jgi:outer membrane protein assembly factor BamB
LTLLALTPSAMAAPSSAPLKPFWVTDGPVHALAEDGAKLYLGGAFSRIGPWTGAGVELDSTTALVNTTLPAFDGPVRAVVPDGMGGWFVGGDFNKAGGVPVANLVRILPDGRLAKGWLAGTNGPVNALLRIGPRLYVGGSFSSLSSASRSNAGAVSVVDGVVDGWLPEPDSSVQRLLAGNGTIYLAGEFGICGGVSRPFLAEVDAVAGVATGFAPNPDARVRSLALGPGSLHVGGDFMNIGGLARQRLAQLDLSTGLAIGPAIAVNGRVEALVLAASKLYLGGQFSTVGGLGRQRLAALDLAGPFVDAWDPGASDSVNVLAAADGRIYAGGDFLTVRGQYRARLAAIQPASGLLDGWAPGANGSVLALSAPGGRVFVGGQLSSVGGLERKNVAALDIVTGQGTSWRPDTDGSVQALALHSGDVYLGGGFTNAGGQPRNNLARVDGTLGNAVLGWSPAPAGPVFALAPEPALGVLYVGGSFNAVDLAARKNAAAVTLASGAVTPFDPSTNGPVQALLSVSTASKVYLGGSFSQIGAGVPRNNLASVVAGTGAALPFDPKPNAGVRALTRSGTDILVGGEFNVIGQSLPLARSALAAVDSTSGNATTWDALLTGGGVPRVNALAIGGSDLLVGGDFQNAALAPRAQAAQLSLAAPATASPWNPSFSAPVRSLASALPRVYAGGDFEFAAGRVQRGLAVYCDTFAPLLLSVTPNGNNRIDLAWNGAAPAYNVYRARSAAGPWQLLGTPVTVTFSDAFAEGGITWHYRITAVNGCESDPSNTLSALAEGACGLAPEFDGVGVVTQPVISAGIPCALLVQWSSGSANCSEDEHYSVYRSTSPGFIPDASTRFAVNLNATSWSDTASLQAGVTYYYVVRAVDPANGEEDPNLFRYAFTPQLCLTSGPAPVQVLTARSTPGANRLEWLNPVTPTFDRTVIISKLGGYPTNVVDGVPVAGSPFTAAPGSHGAVNLTGLSDGTEYFYAAYAYDGVGLFESTAEFSAGRPSSTPAQVRWAYTTGASVLTPAAVLPNRDYLTASNDRFVHATTAGGLGGAWPVGWTPPRMNAPAQGRATVLSLTAPIGSAMRIALVASQDGRVYCFDADTGANVWTSPVLGEALVASPSAMLTAFGGAHNLVFVGTRNAAGANSMVALHLSTGLVAWTFTNGGGSNSLGIVTGQAVVDYPLNRLYFTTRRRGGGSPFTVWAIQFGASSASLVWGQDQGDIDGALSRRGNVLYVGNNDGELLALSIATGMRNWTFGPGTGPVKARVWPEGSGSTRVYFSTTGHLYAVRDDGASVAGLWTQALPDVSAPLFALNRVFVGAGDGALHAFDNAGTPLASYTLGEAVPKIVGMPTFDAAQGLLVMGTEDGRVYAVTP